MKRSRAVTLALVGLFVWATACHSYKQIEIGELAEHGKVRVTRTGGDRETVHDPRVDADSIKGQVNGKVNRSISLDQVTKLEAVEPYVAGTVFIVLGAVVLAGAIFGVIWCSTQECVSGPLEHSL